MKKYELTPVLLTVKDLLEAGKTEAAIELIDKILNIENPDEEV